MNHKEFVMAEKIKVVICTGTACYVMGGAELLGLEERLPPELAARVEIEGTTCLGRCKDSKLGRPPFAKVGEDFVADATVEKLIEAISLKAGALSR